MSGVAPSLAVTRSASARSVSAACGTSQARRSSGVATVADSPMVRMSGASFRSRASPSERRSPALGGHQRMQFVEDDGREPVEEDLGLR